METKINTEIQKVLEQFDQKYILDGVINKSKVIQDLDGYDGDLVTAFLKSEELRKRFTMKIADSTVIKVNDLIEHVKRIDIMVKSVSEFIKEVLKLQKEYIENFKTNESEVTFFFRGQSKKIYDDNEKKFDIKPSLFHKDSIRKSEYEVVQDLQRLDPDAFLNQHSYLDIQKELQHFAEISRVIDITTQALVGLFFAVGESTKPSDNEDNPPCVFMFAVKNDELKRPESDGTQIKLALSTIKKDQREKVACAIKKFEESMSKISEYFYENNDKISGKNWQELTDEPWNDNWNNLELEDMLNEKIFIKKFPKRLKKYIRQEIQNNFYEPNIGNIIRKYYLEEFNHNPGVQKLTYAVRKNDNVMEEIMVPEDINKLEFVLPKMNNKRVIAQQGAFIAVGFPELSQNPKDIEDITEKIYNALLEKLKKDNSNGNLENNLMIIKIDPAMVYEIKKELESLGISKAVMYPDIQRIGKEYYKNDLYDRK